jgi:indolepyruvate ferredoxin oxidoreductase
LAQKRLDKENGLNTAGFVSGCRGSPLGGVDSELWKAVEILRHKGVTGRRSDPEPVGAIQVIMKDCEIFKNTLSSKR